MIEPTESVDLGYGVTSKAYTPAQVAAMSEEEKVLARIKEVLTLKRTGKLNAGGQLDFAERKLKSAAYAFQNGDPEAGFTLAREALFEIDMFMRQASEELGFAYEGIMQATQAVPIQREVETKTVVVREPMTVRESLRKALRRDKSAQRIGGDEAVKRAKEILNG